MIAQAPIVPWTYDGARAEVSPGQTPLAFEAVRFQLLYSFYNQPAPLSGSLGNGLWLRLADTGVRFEEIGDEGSFGYPTTFFHAWRLMLGEHFLLAKVPGLRQWVQPRDRAFCYGGVLRGSGFLQDLGNQASIASDAGIGLVGTAGASFERGNWLFRMTLDDLGFINWADPVIGQVPAMSYTQHLAPHLVADQTFDAGAFSLTHEEVATLQAAEYRAIASYQWRPWLNSRVSAGIDSLGSWQGGMGLTLSVGSYLFNAGGTFSTGSSPWLWGIQTGTAW